MIHRFSLARFFLQIALLSFLLWACPATTAQANIILSNFSTNHPVKIMAIGDSITDDCVTNGAWRSFLQTLLDANGYPFTFVGRNQSEPSVTFTKTQHEGYCGSVIAPPGVLTSPVHGYTGTNVYLQTIVPDALTANTPDIVLLLIGANDIGRGRDPHLVATNDLPQLLHIIFSNAPNANVIVARITSLENAMTGGLNYGAFFANVYIYNALLESVVNQRHAAGQNVFIADAFSVVDPNSMFNTDHLHPNPVGLSAIGQEFFTRIQAITTTTNQVTTKLLAAGSAWKYNDQGQDLGTNWVQPNFNDTTWSNGVGRLGFGDATDATTVSFGTNVSAKNITTYFRNSFVVPDGVVITNLQFRTLRVHGAIVYLNGREAFRSNITNGPIAYTNFSLSSVGLDPASTYYPTNIPITLAAGTNTLAAEVHLRTAMQASMGFDLELIGMGYWEPTLSIATSGGNIIVNWLSKNTTGYSLFANSNLTSGLGWTNANALTQTNAGQISATLPQDSPTKFFRLQHP